MRVKKLNIIYVCLVEEKNEEGGKKNRQPKTKEKLKRKGKRG